MNKIHSKEHIVRRKSNGQTQLRIVVQAVGIYCLAQGLFSVFQATTRYLVYVRAESSTPIVSIRPVVQDSLLYASLVLLLGLILIWKADWFAERVERISSSVDDDTEPHPK